MIRIIFLSILLNIAQILFSQVQQKSLSKNIFGNGICNKNCNNSDKDGNGTLGLTYSNSLCGLNFVQASRKVTT